MKWCKWNNLILNINKTKEMLVDFHRTVPTLLPLLIDGAAVEMVPCIKYLGVHITKNLPWRKNLMHHQKGSLAPLLFKEAEEDVTEHIHPPPVCCGEHTNFLHATMLPAAQWRKNRLCSPWSSLPKEPSVAAYHPSLLATRCFIHLEFFGGTA